MELETAVCQCCGMTQTAEKETETTGKSGMTYVVFGWLFFAISLLFMPLVFGAAALFMGAMTFFERSRLHGAILMAFSAFGLVVGALFSLIVAGTVFF